MSSILGDPGPVVIADYNPDWPQMFETEKHRIVEALGDWLVAIEHIGSTSVPGLAAKPVIDIMAGIRSFDDDTHIIGPLQDLGYEFVLPEQDEIPDRRYCRRGVPRSHHVHVAEIGGRFWTDHLAFRDHLRTHPEAAARYEALKRQLAAQYGSDRLGYVHAKTDFIIGIVQQATGASR